MTRGTESFICLLKIIQLVRGKENVEREIRSLAYMGLLMCSTAYTQMDSEKTCMNDSRRKKIHSKILSWLMNSFVKKKIRS